jgi:hypothetical protein
MAPLLHHAVNMRASAPYWVAAFVLLGASCDDGPIDGTIDGTTPPPDAGADAVVDKGNALDATLDDGPIDGTTPPADAGAGAVDKGHVVDAALDGPEATVEDASLDRIDVNHDDVAVADHVAEDRAGDDRSAQDHSAQDHASADHLSDVPIEALRDALCRSYEIVAYNRPGCGDQAPPTVCVGEPADACLSTVCKCDGVTGGDGCGFATYPFAAWGACPEGGSRDGSVD